MKTEINRATPHGADTTVTVSQQLKQLIETFCKHFTVSTELQRLKLRCYRLLPFKKNEKKNRERKEDYSSFILNDFVGKWKTQNDFYMMPTTFND